MNILTIDPGLHTGLAYWDEEKNELSVSQINVLSGLKDDADKVFDLSTKLSKHYLVQKVINDKWSKVYIEGVQVWSGSLVSMTAATRGNLSLLAYIVGAYTNVFRGNSVEILPPSWKGQLTYDALSVWVKKAIGETYPSEHILSAVGMNLKVRVLL